MFYLLILISVLIPDTTLACMPPIPREEHVSTWTTYIFPLIGIVIGIIFLYSFFKYIKLLKKNGPFKGALRTFLRINSIVFIATIFWFTVLAPSFPTHYINMCEVGYSESYYLISSLALILSTVSITIMYISYIIFLRNKSKFLHRNN